MKKTALLLMCVSSLLLVPACGWCCRKKNDCNKPKCEKKCPKKCDNKRSKNMDRDED